MTIIIQHSMIFFEKLVKFENFPKGIVIPQTFLYIQRKGVVFITTLVETKAYFGMTVVMGYHKLACI